MPINACCFVAVFCQIPWKMCFLSNVIRDKSPAGPKDATMFLALTGCSALTIHDSLCRLFLEIIEQSWLHSNKADPQRTRDCGPANPTPAYPSARATNTGGNHAPPLDSRRYKNTRDRMKGSWWLGGSGFRRRHGWQRRKPFIPPPRFRASFQART